MNVESLPASLKDLIAGDTWTSVAIGRSSATTFRLTGPTREVRFLKIAQLLSRAELRDEKERLEWLNGKLPVPEVILFESDGLRDYLLVTAIPGVDSASLRAGTEGPTIVRSLAEGLRTIHALPVAGCPFQRPIESDIQLARHNVCHDLVDETDSDGVRKGRSTQELLAALVCLRLAEPDTVFTHGDYCLPNVILDGDRVAGFVDWGRAGVADRYKDLAVAVRSVRRNLGSDLEPVFFEAYGISEVDLDKIDFYALLDEFF